MVFTYEIIVLRAEHRLPHIHSYPILFSFRTPIVSFLTGKSSIGTDKILIVYRQIIISCQKYFKKFSGLSRETIYQMVIFKYYPQQLEVSSLFFPAQPEVLMYLPEPDLSICTGTFRTSPKICTRTLRNFT